MAARIVARFVSRRRLSSSGKILSEEEKAAENVYIKAYRPSPKHSCTKMERDKLEKLARKGPKTDEAAAAASYGGGTVTDAKPSTSSASGVEKVSTDKYRNYAVLAGTITALGAIGWYVKGNAKKPEVQRLNWI